MVSNLPIHIIPVSKWFMVPWSISLASADLIDHASTLLGILDDGLCAHASALSSKVDALTWRRRGE